MVESILSATLFGPVFKHESITLRQALRSNISKKKFEFLGTFMPDELVTMIDERKKFASYDVATILLVNVEDLCSLFEDFLYSSQYGISAFSKTLDKYMYTITEQICLSGGDIIEFYNRNFTVFYKLNSEESIHDLVERVISCGRDISDAVEILNTSQSNKIAVRSSISVGKVTFLVVGDGDEERDFVISGSPVTEVKKAITLFKTNYTILTKAAWDHCTKTDYLIKMLDDDHIKIIQKTNEVLLEKTAMNEKDCQDYLKEFLTDTTLRKSKLLSGFVIPSDNNIYKISYTSKMIPPKCSNVVESFQNEKKILRRRESLFESCKYLQMQGLAISPFVPTPILNRIENVNEIDKLTEVKNFTAAVVNVLLSVPTNDVIASLDKFFNLIATSCEDGGYIVAVSIDGKNIEFKLAFGLETYLKDFNHCRFGLKSTMELLNILQKLDYVDKVSASVATGTCICAISGHIARRFYVLIGLPFKRALQMIQFSDNKVICDIDSLVYSGLKKSNFKPLGLIDLEGSTKVFLFEFYNKIPESPAAADLRFAYPLLSRLQELEIFQDILDDIGMDDRPFAGILIEGNSRLGKSRLLDAFSAFAARRQFKVIKIILTTSFVVKPYAVIFEILKQILSLEDSETIDELQKLITLKLSPFVAGNELCYMNRIFKVKFKLSRQYIRDSDWKRHRKCLHIFEKILKKYPANRCILVDNIQFLDYMSWQFISYALNLKNVVVGMALLESMEDDELSRVELDISKDKRLRRHLLGGLDPEVMPTLACQIMHVQGICPKIKKFIISSEVYHPGWFEVLFPLITLCGGFDFKSMTALEIQENDITIPDLTLVTRIPLDVLPEDVMPPRQKASTPVCMASKNFDIAESFVLYDLKALGRAIFKKLDDYEKQVIICASVLGRVFLRDILEKIIPNNQPVLTLKAVNNLMRLRIFECASMQRRPLNLDSSAFCHRQNRATFSDMYHVLRCWCQKKPETRYPKVEIYAYCQYIEFRIPAMQFIVYEQLPEIVKKELHLHVTEIYAPEAKKCVACGGGQFLRIPGQNQWKKLTKPTLLRKTRLSEYIISNSFERLNFEKTVPSMTDYEAEEEEKKEENSEDKSEDDSNSPISSTKRRTTFTLPEQVDELYPLIDDAEKQDDAESRSLFTAIIANCKKSKIHPECEIKNQPTSVQIHNFNQIDPRNCKCLRIVNCIYVDMYNHLKFSENNEYQIGFLMEYSAALIELGQPSYALKFLAKVDMRINYDDNAQIWDSPSYIKVIKKNLISSLRGDAFKLLGNYPQAKSNYVQALSLFGKHSLNSSRCVIKYLTVQDKFLHKLRWIFTDLLNKSNSKAEKKKIVTNQNLADALHLVSETMIFFRKHELAKLTSVQSLLVGFSYYGPENFIDQCELFISMVKVFCRYGDPSFIKAAEKCIMRSIDLKKNWDECKEIIMLVKVYYAIFMSSALQGKFSAAETFGMKALHIAKVFHLTKIEFKVIPTLIEVLVHLKKIGRAMDMLQLLREDAMEDIDKSAMSWYYALCMYLHLVTGLVIETYETCVEFAQKILLGKSNLYVNRDCRGRKRLVVCLWMRQLRRGDLTLTAFVKNLDFFLNDFESADFSNLITLCCVLECHLLLLVRCINMKKGVQTEMLIKDIMELFEILNEAVKVSDGIKPYFYIMKAYFSVLHACYAEANLYLQKAKKYASETNNLMASAWIFSNEKAWKAEDYNNMANYWEENIGFQDTVVWQDLETFEVHDWSSLLYSFPVPDSYL